MGAAPRQHALGSCPGLVDAVVCTALAFATLAADASGQENRLIVPDGFVVDSFASGLEGPRWMAFDDVGALYVTLSRAGQVARLSDEDGDGRAESVATLLDGLDRPHGLAWDRDTLWIATMTRVLGAAAPTRVSGFGAIGQVRVIVDSLPPGGHWTRTLLTVPGGADFLLSIGSSCNVCLEGDKRRAAILRFGADGSGVRIWARGLRNAVGLAIHPETGELWATDNGRDWLGDDLPPEELNRVRGGAHYGWPYCYGFRVPNPEYADPARCDATESPSYTFPAHSAPLGIVFYAAEMYPPEFQGDAFVALHGSWNRSVATEPRVVRVRFRHGRPTGSSDFVTGWQGASGQRWGRPVQTLVGPDGALYVSDDLSGRIWRIAYRPSG